MLRFNIGDGVLILPKFQHLYPADSGVIIRVQPDPFRPLFNEYTVQFPEGSTAHLLEFQLLENSPNYKTLLATVVFDSDRQASTMQIRGPASARQLILRTSLIDVDMKVQCSPNQASIIGQILERDTSSLLRNSEVRFMKESTPLAAATCDPAGIFKVHAIPRGRLNILVLVPQRGVRILGTFSV